MKNNQGMGLVEVLLLLVLVILLGYFVKSGMKIVFAILNL